MAGNKFNIGFIDLVYPYCWIYGIARLFYCKKMKESIKKEYNLEFF